MNTALKHAPPDLDRSLSEVLEAVGRETLHLHNAAVRLQTMAGDLIDRAGLPADDPLFEEAQALDALAQKLDALTEFLARLSQGAPAAWRLDIADAIGQVFLTDLAHRLCCEHAPEADLHPPTGDFELF